MRKTSDNKWFFIGVGFFAIFIIIVAIIISSKISEYNDSKSVESTIYDIEQVDSAFTIK